MIVLDADVLVIDLGHPGDTRRPINRQFLDHIAANKIAIGITSQGLLEVVGKRSHNTPGSLVSGLPSVLLIQYRLTLIPALTVVPEYAGCTVDEIVAQMAQQMSLGDAVMAVQIAKFAPNADALITWNAKHFQGKLVILVLTPEEWLLQQTPPTGPTP